MADYVIKADSGYDSIPVSDFGEQTLDFNNATFVEIEIPAGGTSTEPKSLWESTGGYVRKYGSGNNIQLPYKTMLRERGDRHLARSQRGDGTGDR